MSTDEKHARLEKMIREQLDDKTPDHLTPSYHSSVSLRSEQQDEKQRSRPSSAIRGNQ